MLRDINPALPFPAGEAISFHFVDYVVHGWDVARGLEVRGRGTGGATGTGLTGDLAAIAAARYQQHREQALRSGSCASPRATGPATTS